MKKATIKKINNILAYSLNNKYSDFYNKFITDSGFQITCYEDFQKIPIICKDDILKVEMNTRTFTPNEKIRGFSITSGTTNNRKILTLPFSHPSDTFQKLIINKEKMKKLGVTKLMYLTSPLHGMIRHMIYSINNSIPFVLSKPDDFKLSADILKETKIEGIISTPTIIELFLEKNNDDNLKKQIKWVCLAGEHCSEQKIKFLKEKLPNAYIENVYGSAESGIIGTQCPYISKTNVFHPAEELYIEILNDENKPQKEKNTGNIIITSLIPTAFPLIRYDIKDLGILDSVSCKCGQEKTLKLLGRANFDSIKVQGTVIHAEAVERALEILNSEVEPDFILDVNEKNIKDRLLPEITLKLVLKNPFTKKEHITETIAKNLWVSPTKTLKDLVTAGNYAPLKIEFIDKIKKNPNKKNYSINNYII